jgi:hypothetical protein
MFVRRRAAKDCPRGPEVSTAAKAKRPKPKQAAQAWWARAAYNGQDRTAALAALASSGIPLKSVAGTKDLLSAMARGDALIKGAAGLAVPRRKGGAKSARYHRLLQWRLVMGYAGFEIFAKACLGKPDKGGLTPEEVEHVAKPCGRSSLMICQPVLTPETVRWLSREGAGDPIEVVGDFLRLNKSHRDFLHEWFKGRPITNHVDAIHLAKILRHTTAHGVLSPLKCHGLGFTEALKVLPKVINEVRLAVICRLHDYR